MRRRQLWGSQAVGAALFLRNQESDGALCFPKILALDLALDFGMGEEGVGTCKKYSQFGVSGKEIPHLWALPVQIREGWGPLMWPKWVTGKTHQICLSHIFSLHTGGPLGPQWAYTTPDQPTLVGPLVPCTLHHNHSPANKSAACNSVLCPHPLAVVMRMGEEAIRTNCTTIPECIANRAAGLRVAKFGPFLAFWPLWALLGPLAPLGLREA